MHTTNEHTKVNGFVMVCPTYPVNVLVMKNNTSTFVIDHDTHKTQSYKINSYFNLKIRMKVARNYES